MQIASTTSPNRLFSRWLPCFTLAAWSAVLLHFYLSGRIVQFLAPPFRPGVLITGVLLAGMALLFLFRPAAADCCVEEECGHPLSRGGGGRLLTFGVLLLPILCTAFFSRDAFDRKLIENRGYADITSLPFRPEGTGLKPLELPLPTKEGSIPTPEVAAPPADYLQRTAEGYIVAEVLDLLYAAQDSALRKDFEDKTVQLVGQLMPDKTSAEQSNRFKAVRMFMTCCAADARPVATLVESTPMPDLPEMTWVKITGKATFPLENGRRTAVLKADKVEKAEPPDETMLF